MTTTNIQSFFGNVEVAGTLDVTGTLTSTTGVDKVSLAVDTTDASLPIIFSTGETGSQSLKTDPGITYNPSTNVLAVTSNIGIGTTAPAYTLDVHGSSNVGTLKATTGTFSSNFAVNTDNFFVDTATGRVGVGLTNPGAPLVVEDQVNTTSVYNQGIMKLKRGPKGVGEDKLWIGFSHGSSSADNNDRARIGTHIKTGGLGEIFFTTGAGDGQAERMRITGTGNVGIGTTSPAYTLDVHGTSNVGALTATSATVPNDGDFVMSGKPLQPTAGLHWDKINSRLGVGMTSPQFAVDVDGIINAKGLYLDGTAYTVSPWKLNGNDVYYTTGNVGVGTTNPSDKLHVYGAPMIQHDTRRQITTAAWYKIGTWDATASDGARLKVSLLGGSGYGATDNDRGGETIIYASINNNSPTSVANIDGLVESHGKLVTTQVKFKQVGTDRTKYEIHAYILAYTQHSMSVECSGTTTFTKEWVASSDPGVQSATVSQAIFSTVVDNLGNVGIGTTSPGAKLDVNGSARVGALTATTGTFSSNLAVNTDDFFVDTVNSRVGVGTTTPGYKLHMSFDNVNETFIDDGKIVLGRTENISRRITSENTEADASDYYLSREHKIVRNANLNYRNTGDDGTRYDTHRIVMGYSNVYEIGDNGYYPTYHALKFQVAPTWETEGVGEQDTKMIIQGNGNVGIGTANPIAALDIVGGAEDDTTPALSIRGGLYDTSDLYVLNTYATNTGVGYAAKVIGVNIKNKVETDNTIQVRNNTGGLTAAGAIYLGTDDRFQGIFGVLGVDGAVGTTLTERLTVRAGGNVGIGTTNPAYKLEVSGKVAVPNDGDFVMNSKPLTSASGLHWDTVNSRLGVGTASPSYTLDVNGTVNTGALTATTGTFSGNLNVNSDNGTGSVGTWFSVDTSDSTYLKIGNGYSSADQLSLISAGDIAICCDHNNNSTGKNIDFRTNTSTNTGTLLMRVTDSGNVGIGTASPGAKLDVYNGDIKMSQNNSYGDDRYMYTHWTDSSNDHQIGFEFDYYAGTGTTSTTHSRINFISNANLNEAINGSGKQTMMTVLSNGNVGIGTTSPTYKLDVHGTSNVGALTATSGDFSTTLTVDGELTTKSNVFLGVMRTIDREGTLEFGRADGTDRVHNIKVYNSATQASNYMKFQIHAGGSGTGALTDNVLYLRGDGNVGVGTDNPPCKLTIGDLSHSVDSTGGVLAIRQKGDTQSDGITITSSNSNSTRLYKNADGDFNITNTGGGNISLKNGTGYTGIGTTSPSYKLDVHGTSNVGALTATTATVPNDGDFVMGGKPLKPAAGLHWDRTNSRLGVGTTSPGVKLDVNGSLRHAGLTMSSGGGVDQLKTISKTLQITVAWMDTGISATDLETGTHAVQIYNVSDYGVGGNNYEETYSGIMSWFSGGTNSTEATEIHLTSAGHAPNDNHIYLRVLRSTNASGLRCRLQIRRDSAMTGSYAYTFKFRRLI